MPKSNGEASVTNSSEFEGLLHLTPLLARESGGIGEAVIQLCCALADVSAKPEIIAYESEEFQDDRLSKRGIRPQLLQRLGPASVQYAPKLKSAIGLTKPRVIHQHGMWQYTSLAMTSLKRKFDFGHVLSPHGMLDPWAINHRGFRKRWAARLFENRNLASANCIHALCEPEVRAIRDFGVTTPIARIPNGVSLPSDIQLEKPELLRAAQNRKVLLFLGRIHEKKGIDLLLQAFQQIHHPEWCVVIAGWGDENYLRQLNAQVDSLGLRDSVFFVGSVYGETKTALFQHADAFVLPSHSEGLPMAVLEAWSHRLPTLITQACNLPEGGEHAAALECVTSVDAIGESLNQLFAMTEDQQLAMGSNARKLVEDKFTWSVIARSFIEVYRWILGECSKPTCVTD